ncbi:hypothetical protein BBJ28_00021509 [Nothophytophthora sp. Chile5]|nr:hypothetical protein BBJ28_00021509 [Nothophytophthora sp. Chile5]
MFVFEAADGGAFTLLDVATKAQLPFDEFVVVAGRLQSARQLTCLGGRVKLDGKRRLLILPLPRQTPASTPSVQVLDVGEVAVRFLQDVRSCFPTLVRKNPMVTSMDSDEDSSDSDDEADGDVHKKQKCNTEATPAADSGNGQLDQPLSEAVTYMRQTRVKMLASLEELFSAFHIADPSIVQTALRNDPSFSESCQLLCLDCPALLSTEVTEPANAVHPSTPSPAFNFGVMYSEMTISTQKQQFLRIPVPRSPRSQAAETSKEEEETPETFQDATVLSFGAKREATTHGGGKSCDEMVKNIRMRHASGTFCTLVLPATTWDQVTLEYETFLPQVRELQGELRLRRLMGSTPSGVPVELLLES